MSEERNQNVSRWNDFSALLGALVWMGLLLWNPPFEPFGLIEKLFLLAPLVIVPLGMRLAANLDRSQGVSPIYHFSARLQPFAAVFAVFSFFFPPGKWAGALAGPWLLLTLLMALWGLTRFRQNDFSHADEACIATGLFLLSVGGGGLTLSRLGASPLGFREPIVLLVAVHFHYTAFVAPLLAGATGNFIQNLSHKPRILFRAIALGVIAGSPLIALGFIFSPLLKIASVILLAFSLILLAFLQIGLLGKIKPWTSKVLLGLSSVSVLVGMILAGIYAVGEYRGEILIGITKMAKTHGLFNSLGFSVCGLLAWRQIETVRALP